MTAVVHVNSVDWSHGGRGVVYIGRAMPRRFPASKWGNPFKLPKGAGAVERLACLVQYEAWLLTQPQLMAALPELRGKRLACWCAPLACHGHVLARLAHSTQVHL